MPFKPIFELSLSEQADLLRTPIEQVQQENLHKGLYNSYRDDHGQSPDQFIRAYADRKELVQVNATNGQTMTVRKVR